jgi:integrase
MLLSEFFRGVYIPRKLRGKSPGSIRLYWLCLSQFDRSIGKIADVSDLTEDNILLHLSRRSHVAPATRNKELSQLLALWRFAAQRGVLDSWPHIDKEHEPERDPIAWMPDELEKLLAGAAKVAGKIGNAPASLFWLAMIRTILDTGERVGAVRQIKTGWLQGEWLLVPAEARKGKTRDRRYRLSAETIAAIAELRKHTAGSCEVFPWPYGETYLWNRFKLVLKSAGLPCTRKHQLHCLRKTVGTAVHASGGSAQDALDHADRRTTQRYIDPRAVKKDAPCDILAAYLANPTKPPAVELDAKKRTG